VSFKSARVWPAVVAGVILAGAAAGCSSSGGTSGGTPVSTTMPVVTGLETKNIVVSDFPAIDSAGLFIAASEGLFAKEGLNVKVVPDFKSSQDTVNNIESGKFQVSSGDYVTYMNDEVSGSTPQLEIIGEGSVLQPNVLALMAGPGNKVTKLSQIKGTAVPISGPNDIGSLLIDALLASNGIPVDSVHYVPNQQLPAVPAMVAKGAFAMGPVPEPFVSQGQQQFGDKVLADLDQGSVTSFPIQGYAVTPQWAKQNPNTLKAFVTALDEGQEIADTNRAAVEKAIEPPLRISASEAAVISLPNFPVGVSPTRIQRVMTDMIQFGFFKGSELSRAQSFQAKNVVYASNLATGSGQSDLLAGG
jgi:NitT/TauT family transport system substrate-binding protein